MKKIAIVIGCAFTIFLCYCISPVAKAEVITTSSYHSIPKTYQGTFTYKSQKMKVSKKTVTLKKVVVNGKKFTGKIKLKEIVPDAFIGERIYFFSKEINGKKCVLYTNETASHKKAKWFVPYKSSNRYDRHTFSLR